MSGGYFDYKCFQIADFASELEHEIAINSDECGREFKKETLSRLVAAQQIIETAGRLAKEIEWLYSDDHGENPFNAQIDKILEGK